MGTDGGTDGDGGTMAEPMVMAERMEERMVMAERMAERMVMAELMVELMTC